MKIVVENLSEGEVIPYPLLLVKGRVENLDLDAMKGNYGLLPLLLLLLFQKQLWSHGLRNLKLNKGKISWPEVYIFVFYILKGSSS